MSKSAGQFRITLGGWYQRTTLHLSEIYDLFTLGQSSLDLDANKMSNYHQNFNFASVSREVGELEYVKAVTASGIEVRYYEDGLYVLETTTTDINNAESELKRYFDLTINPAVNYIFSLGAPTPKILADIKTLHPVVVSRDNTQLSQVLKSFDFGPIYSQITSKGLTVCKTPRYILIVNQKSSPHTQDLIEMQIFFREFKDHLQRYLNIHRRIWEDITEIKENGQILGQEVEVFRRRLDSYQKTIGLIRSRINQMKSYVNTRASLSKKLNIESDLVSLFQYKFETLTDTHTYIQEIWNMTQEYVNTAIQVIVEVKGKTTQNSIDSLRLITTTGVLASIFAYLSKDAFPKFTFIGLWYFLVLLTGTWLVSVLLSFRNQKQTYKLNFTDTSTVKP